MSTWYTLATNLKKNIEAFDILSLEINFTILIIESFYLILSNLNKSKG